MATLFIGNKNYSSWSLRPWLCLQWAQIPFDEHLIHLRQPGYGEGKIMEVLRVSPTGRVPALHAGNLHLWDSLAIAEWAAEQVADSPNPLWPSDPEARALARAAACEMHSGFMGLRTHLPMNIHRRSKVESFPLEAQVDIDRVVQLWTQLRERFADQGPWLAGTRSIADAFFLPVVTRLRSYGAKLNDAAGEYSATALADPAFQQWEAAAEPDSWDAEGYPKIDGAFPEAK